MGTSIVQNVRMYLTWALLSCSNVWIIAFPCVLARAGVGIHEQGMLANLRNGPGESHVPQEETSHVCVAMPACLWM